jgi:hypothetical protein
MQILAYMALVAGFRLGGKPGCRAGKLKRVEVSNFNCASAAVFFEDRVT